MGLCASSADDKSSEVIDGTDAQDKELGTVQFTSSEDKVEEAAEARKADETEESPGRDVPISAEPAPELGVALATVLEEAPEEQSQPSRKDLKRTGTESLNALSAEKQSKVQELIKGHYIFEAYEECPEYVECKGFMTNFRDTAKLLCGEGNKMEWEKTMTGDLGDGDQWMLQYCWGGAEPASPGNDYLWVKLSVDQGIPWWKSLAGWQEPELDSRDNPLLKEAQFVATPTPCYGIRCNIGGIAGRLFGYTQDYIEVFRYLNKETGVCIECNKSVDHEDLAKQGYNVGKAKYPKGNDMLLYVVSFPRTKEKSTAILFSRLQLHLPGWLVKKILNNLGPRLIRSALPTMMKKQGSDPEFLAAYDKDKDGVYAYFKDFTEKGLEAMEKQSEKYCAANLPPASVVMGRFSEPQTEHTELPKETLTPGEKLAPPAGDFPKQKSSFKRIGKFV